MVFQPLNEAAKIMIPIKKAAPFRRCRRELKANEA
jgi:hypothetical protein